MIGLAILIFTIVCVTFLSVLLVLSWCVRPIAKRKRADSTYECGIPAEGEHRGIGFNYIQYAILFLVFDLAAIYLFLYTVLPAQNPVVMTSFVLGLFTLILTIIYATRRGRYVVA